MTARRGARAIAARCISLNGAPVAGEFHNRRCPRKAGKRSGDLYLCRRCATPWEKLMVGDQYSRQTRELLAYSAWDTAAEGQALLDRALRAAGVIA